MNNYTTITLPFAALSCITGSVLNIARSTEAALGWSRFMPALVDGFWISRDEDADTSNPAETVLLVNNQPVGNRRAVVEQYVAGVWLEWHLQQERLNQLAGPKPGKVVEFKGKQREHAKADPKGAIKFAYGELMQLALAALEIATAAEQPGTYEPTNLPLTEKPFVISCPHASHLGNGADWNSVLINGAWFGNRYGAANEYVNQVWQAFSARQAATNTTQEASLCAA